MIGYNFNKTDTTETKDLSNLIKSSAALAAKPAPDSIAAAKNANGGRTTQELAGDLKQSETEYNALRSEAMHAIHSGDTEQAQQLTAQRDELQASIAALRNAGITTGEKLSAGATVDRVLNAAVYGVASGDVNAVGTVLDAVGAKKTAKKLQELSDSMGDQAGAYTSQAKDAKSGLGKLAVDVGINAAQMGMDAVGGVFTGGNNLIPMAIRSFGGGAQEARQSGASTARQLAYGAGSAAVEVLTEKMFDGLAGVYGKGGADEIVEKAIKRLTKNEATRRALTVAASAAGESIEEFASGIVNPALRTIYNGKGLGQIYSELEASDILYDMLIGGIMGAVGGTANATRTAVQNIVSNTPTQQSAQNTPPVAAGARQNVAEGNLTPAQIAALTGQKTGNTATERTTNENGLVALTMQERINLASGKRNKVISTFSDAVDFIRNALTNRQSTDRAYMGKITDATAAKVLTETGVDVKGYNAILPSDNVRHIMKSHGDAQSEAARGQIAVAPEDIALIPEVLAAPDAIRLSSETDSRGRPVLVFEKQIGDNFVTMQAVADGTHSLQTDTLYKQKRKNPQGTEYYNAGEITDPAHNVRNVPPQGSFNFEPTIPQPSNVVKGVEGSTRGDVNTEQRGDYGSATGAAEQGFSVSHGEQVPTQNRTVTDSRYMTTDEQERLAPQTHERVTEGMSIERAAQQFYADENGEMTHLDDTIRGLLEKETWLGEDQDAAQIAMTRLIERSRAERRINGEVSEETRTLIQNLARAIEEIGGTEAGRSLQARQKWINSPSDIISRSQRVLDSARENTNRQDVLDTITDFTLEFDDAMDAGDWAGIGDIIRRTSRFRRTGSFFTNNWSRTMENALNHVVEQAANGDTSAQEFLENHAANGLVAIAQDFTPVGAATGLLTIRRNAMLSKVSTTLRNFISNNVFDPIDSVSRDISAAIDTALSHATGTRSVAVDYSWFSAAKRRGAMEGLERSILEVGLDVDASGERSRYENGARRTFSMQGGTFSRLLSTWEKHLGYRLYSTDQFQKGGIDAEVQRGIDRLYERNLITRQNADGQRVVDESLRDAGATEALYRTFQDSTMLSRAVLGVRRGINEVQVGGVGLGDIAIPFAQVPANLGTRALEYSPLNIARGTVQLAQVLRAAHNGTLTAAQQAQAVQSIGRGMNGTALIAGAVALALKGVLHVADVGGDEDKDKKALERAAGITGTQLNLSAVERWARGESTEWRDGDVLHAIGYLDPLNAMLTTGALIARDIQEDGVTAAGVLKDSLDGTIQSVLEIPVMQTLKDTADAFNYSNESTTGGKARNAAAEFAAGQVSSIIPNSIKGIAQGTDRYQRDAYTSNSVVGQTWDAIKASIPGLRETLPEKLDSYGQPIENADPLLNFINANISPGTYVRYQRPQQSVTAELDRLNDVTGDAAVYPSRSAPNSVTNSGNKYELTADEKEQFKQTAGAEFLKFATAIINGRQYSALSDGEKADALSSAVVYANAKARKQFINSKGGSYTLTGEARTVEKAMKARGAGIDPSEYFVLKVVHDEINSGDGTAAQKATKFAQYLGRQPWLNDAKRETIQELLTYSSGFRAEANDKALAAEQYGVSIDEFYKAKAAMDADENGNLKKDEVIAYLNANYPADKRRGLFELFGGDKWKNPY